MTSRLQPAEFTKRLNLDIEISTKELLNSKCGISSQIPKDIHCSFRMGKTSSKFKCLGCRKVSGVVRPTNELSKIKVGNLRYKIERFDLSGIRWNLGKFPNIKALNVLYNENFLSCCPELEADPEYIEADNFTGNLVTKLIFEGIKKAHGIPTFRINLPFICGDTGYIIRESGLGFMDLVGKDEIMDERDVLSIMKQILAQCYILGKYHPILGIPDYRCLEFKLESSTIDVGELQLKNEFTLYMEPTEFSSVTLDNKRVYTNTPVLEFELSKLNLTNTVKSKEILLDFQDLSNPIFSLVYTLTPENNNFYLDIRQNGIPLFSSFDIYSIFYSMMSYRPFYKAVESGNKSLEIWNSLWFPDDLIKVNNLLKKYHGENLATVDNVIKDLANINLKCNLLGELIKFIS